MYIHDLISDEDLERHLSSLRQMEKIQSCLQAPDDELDKMIEDIPCE